ncbi:LLM class flavin-dependent oxidoreductase [Streptomyces violascens]|uniref:LLM class flavin-dependent oxidoreductase n=1 Tax=Streptomyces violascens TaxID=67381 RepID=UPI0036664229
MRTSVIFPVMATDPADLVPFAELVRDGLAERLWQGQSLSLETHQTFAYLAGMGFRIPVGTSVALMPMRHFLDAAVQAKSLARLTGQSMVMGIGPGSPDFVTALRGGPYASPRDAVSAYLCALQGLLRGEDDLDGLPGSLLPAHSHPQVEVGLGVLRPVLARVAGQAADVAITWMTPPSYVRDELLPALVRGAQEADRAVPRVATVVHIGVAHPDRNPYRIAYDAAHTHLSAPHYTDMLRRAGVRAHPASPYLGARALVDSGTFLYGPPDEVAASLAAYGRAGVDEVILNVAGVGITHGFAAAAADLHDVLTAVQDHRVAA